MDAACEDCHLDVFATTTEPDHEAEGYATACADCHSSKAWRPATIDHAAFGFPLEGAHVRIRCSACHGEGAYDSLEPQCWSCHEEDYGAAVEPDHSALEFPTECQECHTAEAWAPGDVAMVYRDRVLDASSVFKDVFEEPPLLGRGVIVRADINSAIIQLTDTTLEVQVGDRVRKIGTIWDMAGESRR